MAYKKGHPIRIKLTRGNYDFLMGALETNEVTFNGFISDGAKRLREKIEKYGVFEQEGEDEIVRLGFYEKEAEQFIWQFIASAVTSLGFLDMTAENPN